MVLSVHAWSRQTKAAISKPISTKSGLRATDKATRMPMSCTAKYQRGCMRMAWSPVHFTQTSTWIRPIRRPRALIELYWYTTLVYKCTVSSLWLHWVRQWHASYRWVYNFFHVSLQCSFLHHALCPLICLHYWPSLDLKESGPLLVVTLESAQLNSMCSSIIAQVSFAIWTNPPRKCMAPRLATRMRCIRAVTCTNSAVVCVRVSVILTARFHRQLSL